VPALIYAFGHASSETWTAIPWERFASLIAD